MKRSITVRDLKWGRDALPRVPIIRHVRIARDKRTAQSPNPPHAPFARGLQTPDHRPWTACQPIPPYSGGCLCIPRPNFRAPRSEKLPNEPIWDFSICPSIQRFVELANQATKKTNPFSPGAPPSRRPAEHARRAVRVTRPVKVDHSGSHSIKVEKRGEGEEFP